MLSFLIAAALAESIVEIVNNDPSSTWVAVEYPRSVMTKARFDAMLMDASEPIVGVPRRSSISAPEHFDAREQWPGKMIGVKDQSACGASWAIALAVSISDRFAVAGCGFGELSAQDIISCDPKTPGCTGGNVNNAVQYAKDTGLASAECIPSVSGGGRVPACPVKCQNGSAIVRRKIVDARTISGEAAYTEDLYKLGPFVARFNVYSDFMNYRSGVYVHKTGSLQGGHIVVVIGWGVQDSTKYWICQNSWGQYWGEKGYFKFLRGENHCNIETSGIAVDVKC